MIKSIIFDLGNVIVNVDSRDKHRKFAEISGKTADEIRQYFEKSIHRKNFEKGKITSYDFYKTTKNDLSIDISFGRFKILWIDKFTLNREIADLITNLRGRYRLVLLSNTNEIHFENIINRFKILEKFDEMVLSYKAGFRKPNPMIYLSAISKCGTFPWRCAYIDDIAEFIKAGRLLMLKSIQYENYESLLEKMKKIGIRMEESK